jgi:hypothetical protein
MKIVGCDLHARQQTIAMVDTESGEFFEKTLAHEGNAVREFYAALEGGAVVGIEATVAMQWFLELREEAAFPGLGSSPDVLPDTRCASASLFLKRSTTIYSAIVIRPIVFQTYRWPTEPAQRTREQLHLNQQHFST